MEVPAEMSAIGLLNGPPCRVHLLGITGAGMKALAEVLCDLGWTVSGCDEDLDPAATTSLCQLMIPIEAGHAVEHLRPAPDLVIYSPAVSPSQPERQEATFRGIPQVSYVEALRQLSRRGVSIAIAGTHGKSTTTAMVGHILQETGNSPTVFCGAELSGRARNGWSSSGELVVFEACEYRRHFLGMSARVRCVTGIDADHFDCFPRLEDAEAAFAEFMAELPADGTLVYRHDCPVTDRLVRRLSSRAVSFAVDDPGADWHAKGLVSEREGTTFRIGHGSGERRTVRVNVPGRHNVANALAALATAATLDVPLQDAAAALESFAGVRRRFERLGRRDYGLVIDDYAHHPTEIRAVLATARQCYPGQRLVCVFQPHQLSRTEAMFDEFAEALALADRVFLLPVYAARETADGRCLTLSEQLAKSVLSRGTPATLIPALDHVWTTLQTGALSDDVILTLGAGTITRIHHEPD